MLQLLALLQTQLPQPTVADPGVIATNQRITPAGVQTVFSGEVRGVRFGGTADEIWVAVPGTVFRMRWADNTIANKVTYNGSGGAYALTKDPGSGGMLFSLVGRLPRHAVDSGKPIPNTAYAQLTMLSGDTLRSFGAQGGNSVGGPAVAMLRNSSGHRVAVLPGTADDRLTVIDIDSGEKLYTVAIGVAPVDAVVAGNGSVAWVSEMAGRPPAANERSVKQCCSSKGEKVRVDARGIAAEGAVAQVDLVTGTLLGRVSVGLHPTALAWDESRQRLYVADGNSDQVSVVDTRTAKLVSTIPISPFQMQLAGLSPTALALSPTGSQLFVALGGINAVAMYDLTSPTPTLLGMIPSAWYPTSLDVSPDGKFLAIGSLLGVGAGNGTTGGSPLKNGRFVFATRGAVNVLEIPDVGRMAAYTVAVSENNRLPLARSTTETAPAPATVPRAVPLRPGDPSLIKHVVYIIKENRTYDQILGDLGRGDGDSSLVIYGRDVTPNQHALSEQFVTLDRFFASGGNSADGHQWLTQANETEYTLWPLYGGRSYPYDGTDPLAYSNGGFIWDAAASKGKRVAVFGEFAEEEHDSGAKARQAVMRQYQDRLAGRPVPLPSFAAHSDIPSLDRILIRDFPTWTLGVPDVVRAEIFSSYLSRWKSAGEMPDLVMIQLPSNHTAGTSQDWCTPRACVADNDLALGQIVDSLTHSPFWKDMAILVVEDDAQNGVDHIDGHRTVALAISPYTKRGSVDGTFYNHPSLLRTIELMLGLPALTMFDLVASDLGASFIGPEQQPDFTSYTTIAPKQSIFEQNPRAGTLKGPARSAEAASRKMRFDVPDAAPTESLNKILWQAARGWDTPYPGVRQALFLPLSRDVADEDREEARERAAAAKKKGG